MEGGRGGAERGRRLLAFLRRTPLAYLLVGIGGFLGANARLLVSTYVVGHVRTRFPLATFAINVSGSLMLGVLGGFLTERVTPHSEWMRLALGVGFLGAYTTFST